MTVDDGRRDGAPSALAASEAAFAAIDKWNASTRAMLSVAQESARETARELDERLARGEWCGLLAGIWLALLLVWKARTTG